MVNEIVNAIEKIIRKKDRCILAIDGRCGSGKTSLAERLMAYFDCNVIHMDDFFLQAHQRSEERLSEPGGNVDYERFYNEVLVPLSKSESFSYRRFDCSTFQLGEPIEVNVKPLTVIEGSYSCHSYLFDGYDLRIFIDIDKNTQKLRLMQREGVEKLKQFTEKWIPMEERYFSCTELKYKCEIYYKTSV